MRTIIAGSRNVTDYNIINFVMFKIDWKPTEIISGTANGVDKLGEQWAIKNNIPLKQYPADWNKYGKSAGYKRNLLMAENADALVAIWDGISKGTKHMIDIAKKKNIKTFIYIIRENND
jgi:hypothetical protein